MAKTGGILKHWVLYCRAMKQIFTRILLHCLQKIFLQHNGVHQWLRMAWRLHPPQAIPGLMLRAEDSLLSPKERAAAITALAFINNKAAVDSMFALTKSHSKDVTEQAAYWLSFRQSNDWY